MSNNTVQEQDDIVGPAAFLLAGLTSILVFNFVTTINETVYGIGAAIVLMFVSTVY